MTTENKPNLGWVQDERDIEARERLADNDAREALKALLDRYTSLVNCGDCGNWDPETEAVVIKARAALAAPSLPAGGGLTDEQRTKVRDAIAEALGDAYDCLRVWSAWGVRTMGPDDFALVAEDDDRLNEITDAAIGAILAAPRQPGEMGAGVPEGWVPLTLEFDQDGPEDVAYGPKRMMDRLGKWLDNYFKLRISEESKEAGSELDEQTVSLRAYVSVRDSFLRIEKICREHGYNYDSVIHDWLEKTLDARVPTKPIAWMRSGNTAWTGFVMHEDKVRLLPHSPETAQYDIPLYAHPAASAQQDEPVLTERRRLTTIERVLSSLPVAGHLDGHDVIRRSAVLDMIGRAIKCLPASNKESNRDPQ